MREVVALDGADVLPVAAHLVPADLLPGPQHGRDDVPADVVPPRRPVQNLEMAPQRCGVEDAERGEDQVARRLWGLLLEIGEDTGPGQLDHAEQVDEPAVDPLVGHGERRTGLAVLPDDPLVVQPVHVVRVQDHDVAAARVEDPGSLADQRVGRSPFRWQARRRQRPGERPVPGEAVGAVVRAEVDPEALPAVPRPVELVHQQLLLVLRQQEHLRQATGARVGEAEVDEPALRAEGDERLGPTPPEGTHPAALTTGEQYGSNVLHPSQPPSTTARAPCRDESSTNAERAALSSPGDTSLTNTADPIATVRGISCSPSR